MQPSSASSDVAPRESEQSFHDACCRRFGWPAEEFARRAFWWTLYPHARLLALLAGRGANLFVVDRALIEFCGRLTSLHAIDAELDEHARYANRGFLRRHCRVRISLRRLRTLAQRCFTS